ncbi:MAG: hypothetical protein AB4062_05905 [Crocosphaera sp.]
MGNFLLGTVLTAGSALLLGQGRSQNTRQTQKVERNKQDNFNQPRSSYGDYVSRVWGWGRVSGILIYNLLPPVEEVSVTVTEETQSQPSGGKGGGRNTTTTVTEERTYSYYGDGAWILSQEVSSDALKEVRLNGRLFWKDGTMDSKYSSQGCLLR